MTTRLALVVVSFVTFVGVLVVAQARTGRSDGRVSAVDLAGGADLVVTAGRDIGSLGAVTAGLGDVTGDRLGDVAVAAPQGSVQGRFQAGVVYVASGRRTPGRIDPSSRSFRGFRIIGPSGSARAGSSLAAAGDVNGDGLRDVVVGAPGAIGGGAAFVVFGKRDRHDVDLAALGSRGFALRIPGRLAVGSGVAGVGDMNHDGLADVAVSALEPDGSGSVYVTPGERSSGLRDLGGAGRGFRVSGLDAGSSDFGTVPTVSGAGDVNADGTPDLVIGTPSASESAGGPLTGGAVVIFGKASPSTVDTKHLGRRGFHIIGTSEVGAAVAGAGDVNRSGHAAVIISGRDPAAAVVFGSRSSRTVDLGHLGRRGYLVRAGDNGLTAVAGIGDVNGDRRADVLVGDSLTGLRDRPGAGAGYVLFGKSTPAPLDLRHLAGHGYRIDGASRDAGIGQSVTGAGDVNGDRKPDFIVGSEVAGPRSGGAAYVLFDKGPPRLALAGATTVVTIAPRFPFKLTIGCPATTVGHCAGWLDLRQPSHSMLRHRSRFRVRAGARSVLRLVLSRRAQATLKDQAVVRAQVVAVAKDDRGVRAVSRKTLEVRSR